MNEQGERERVYVLDADLGNVTLSLGYIVARTTNPFAEINGVEVFVGSEIEGFVVEEDRVRPGRPPGRRWTVGAQGALKKDGHGVRVEALAKIGEDPPG